MRHRPLNPSIKPIIDVTTLQLIIQSTDSMYMGHIFKAAILLSFFIFVRISNLVPHCIASYDPLKQLSRGNIIFAHPGVHMIIKWSKTLQNKDKIKVLKVPSLGTSALCPVAALKKYFLLLLDQATLPCFKSNATPNGYLLMTHVLERLFQISLRNII